MLHGDKLGIRLGSTLFSSSNLLSLPAEGELSSAAVWPRLTSALVGVLIWCLTRGAVPTESVQLSFPVPLSSFQSTWLSKEISLPFAVGNSCFLPGLWLEG